MKEAYANAVSERITPYFSLPSFLRTQGLKAFVMVHVDSHGNVVQMEFTRVSGNTLFDNNVEAAIRKASPLPPPPADLAAYLRKTGMLVGFPL